LTLRLGRFIPLNPVDWALLGPIPGLDTVDKRKFSDPAGK